MPLSSLPHWWSTSDKSRPYPEHTLFTLEKIKYSPLSASMGDRFQESLQMSKSTDALVSLHITYALPSVYFKSSPDYLLYLLQCKCYVRWDQISRSVVSDSLRPMNRSTPGLPVHHQLPEFTQTHIHQVTDAIQPSHPLSSPSLPATNPSQHQSLFQWVNSSHEVAKVLEFQL